MSQREEREVELLLWHSGELEVDDAIFRAGLSDDDRAFVAELDRQSRVLERLDREGAAALPPRTGAATIVGRSRRSPVGLVGAVAASFLLALAFLLFGGAGGGEQGAGANRSVAGRSPADPAVVETDSSERSRMSKYRRKKLALQSRTRRLRQIGDLTWWDRKRS